MNLQPVITLAMSPAGAELIVQRLRTTTPLPDPNVDNFIANLWGQYQAQMQAATAPKDGPATTPLPDAQRADGAPVPQADEAVSATAN